MRFYTVLSKLVFYFVFFCAFQSFSTAFSSPLPKVISRLGGPERQQWQLLKTIEKVSLLSAPRSRKTILTLHPGDEVLVADYQEHVFAEAADKTRSELWLQLQTLKGVKGWTLREGSAFETIDPLEDEKLADLRANWKESEKSKFLAWEEVRQHLEKKTSFEFGTAYRPRTLKGFVYPQPAFYFLYFEGLAGKFKFSSCKDLQKLIRKDFPLKTLGQKPYQVRSNAFSIETDQGYSSNMFLKNCQDLAEKNTYVCPNYTQRFEKVLAKAGPLLTIEFGYMGGSDCGPSYSEVKIKTIDLRTGKVAVVSDFFEKTSLLEALSKDDVVQEKMQASKESNKSFETILGVLQLGGFAVYEPALQKDKVRIRWSSEIYECGMCPNQYQWLGLDVKPQPWFMDEFKKLDPKKELFLLQ